MVPPYLGQEPEVGGEGHNVAFRKMFQTQFLELSCLFMVYLTKQSVSLII
jgi:hypothetical protein